MTPLLPFLVNLYLVAILWRNINYIELNFFVTARFASLCGYFVFVYSQLMDHSCKQSDCCPYALISHVCASFCFYLCHFVGDFAALNSVSSVNFQSFGFYFASLGHFRACKKSQ